MTMNHNSTEIMRDEILAEARKEAEVIVARAREEAEELLKRAVSEAEHIRKEQLDKARSDATRQSALIVATVPVEAGRLRAGRIDALLESVHEEAFQRLLDREGFDYRETLIILASDAMTRMAGNAFVIKLPDTDQIVLDGGLADEIALRVGRSVTIAVSRVPGITGGGVIIEDAEGRQVWDNCLVKRLERLWPEMRRQIAVQMSFVPANTSAGAVKEPAGMTTHTGGRYEEQRGT